jgi:hypothetical protein
MAETSSTALLGRYNAQQFDTEFVEVLRKVSLEFIKAHSNVTLRDLTDHISAMGIAKVQ